MRVWYDYSILQHFSRTETHRYCRISARSTTSLAPRPIEIHAGKLWAGLISLGAPFWNTKWEAGLERLKHAPSRTEGGTHGHTRHHHIVLEFQISETFRVSDPSTAVDLAFILTRPDPIARQSLKESIWSKDLYGLLIFQNLAPTVSNLRTMDRKGFLGWPNGT